MAPSSLSGVVQVSGSPKILNWFEQTLFVLFLKLHCGWWDKEALAHTPCSDAQVRLCFKGEDKIFSDQHMISRHPKVWIAPDKRQLNGGSSFSCLLFFTILNESPATSVVSATLFVCGAPEMFCGPQNFLFWDLNLRPTFGQIVFFLLKHWG